MLNDANKIFFEASTGGLFAMQKKRKVRLPVDWCCYFSLAYDILF